MLVLTRKQNEKIQIGDQITIKVLKMKGKTVRLGIEAPPEVSVIRGEIAFEIEKEEVARTAQEFQCESDSSDWRHGTTMRVPFDSLIATTDTVLD